MRDIPDVHYDARWGWFRFSPTGRLLPLKSEPFASAKEAIAYALKQLKDPNAAPHAIIINARKALEWAKAREENVVSGR